jgi:hypothetical protein
MHKVAYTITKYVKNIAVRAAHSLVSVDCPLQAARACSSQLVEAWSSSLKNDIGKDLAAYDTETSIKHFPIEMYNNDFQLQNNISWLAHKVTGDLKFKVELTAF